MTETLAVLPSVQTVDRLPELREVLQALHQHEEEPEAAPLAAETAVPKKHKTHLFKRKKHEELIHREPVTENEAAPERFEMPQFFETARTIREKLNYIEANRMDADRIHRDGLLAISQEDTIRYEYKINMLVNQTNATARDTCTRIKQLRFDNERLAKAAPEGSGDIRMRLAQHDTLVRKFKRNMDSFRATQNEYKDKHRDLIIRKMRIIDPDSPEDKLNELVEDEDSYSLDVRSVEEANVHLKSYKARRQSIQMIEKNISTIQQMYVEINNLLLQEGEMLDHVEDYVRNTVNYIENANVHLEQAVVSQKNIRKLRFCVIN